jgi:hypothetical protein
MWREEKSFFGVLSQDLEHSKGIIPVGAAVMVQHRHLLVSDQNYRSVYSSEMIHE